MCSATDCKNWVVDSPYKMCARCRATTSRSLFRRRWLARLDVFEYYGKACVCCGELHPEFLTIDHINGREPRAEVKGIRGTPLYYWLSTHGFPEGFRTLCMSCNFALGYFGKCPHGGLVQVSKVGRPDEGKVSEAVKTKQREYNREMKIAAVAAYGGACSCCGETRFELVNIASEGGVQFRKKLGCRNLYVWLKQNGYPSGFYVRCMNCNFSLTQYGYCPHQQVAATG